MAKLMPNGKQQFFDANGDPLASGKVYAYAAGTNTPKDTYTSYTGGTANANPVILDSRGEATIFFDGAYKIVLKDSADATIWTVDNITTLATADDVSYDGDTLASLLKDNLVYVVDTINTLRAVDKTKYTHVFVNGYYAARDGGGGMYYFDSTDTTSIDNGGTTIVATDSARWKLIHNGSVDLAQFGAKNFDEYSDTFDNASVIQNALNITSDTSSFYPVMQNITVSNSYYIATDIEILATARLIGSSALNQNFMEFDWGVSYPGIVTAESGSPKILLRGQMIGLQISPIGYSAGKTGTNSWGPGSNYVPVVIGYDDISYNAQAYSYDCLIERCAIMGYDEYGITTDSTVNDSSRYTVKDCIIDCKSGISHTSTCNVTIDGLVMPYNLNYANGALYYTAYGVNISGAVVGAVNIRNCVFNEVMQPIRINTNAATDCVIDRCTITQQTTTTNYPIYSDITGKLTVKDCAITSDNTDTYSIKIINGSYSITNTTMDGDIRLAAGADYGHVFGNNIQTVSGDAAAIVKCMQSNPLFTHTATAWTPVLKHAAVERVTAYTTQVGQYTVHDNMVTAICNITVNTIAGGAAGDAATIAGLPYSAAATITGGGYATYTAGLVTVADGITASIQSGTTYANLYQGSATGSAILTYADTAAGCTLNYVFTYFIDR